MLIPFDQLWKRYRITSEGVLHLGAHLGQEALAYAALGVRRVVWVEALPDIHARLAERVAQYPGSVALRACLSEADGDKVTFRRANNESQSSSFLEFGTHAQEYPGTKFVEEIEMLTSRVDTLLREYEITIGTGWFLNVDLQGAELKALKGMGKLLWNFDFAYVEVNEKELYKGCPMVCEIDSYLDKFGFAGAETKMMKATGWGDKLYVRKFK